MMAAPLAAQAETIPDQEIVQDLTQARAKFMTTAEWRTFLENSDGKNIDDVWDLFVASVDDADIPAPSRALARDTTTCIAQAIYHESRGEDIKGQLAVASVIYNRADANRWSNTECGVISWKNAFSFVKKNGSLPPTAEKGAWKSAWLMANVFEDSMKGLEGVDHFHTTSTNPGWARKMKRVTRIGAHYFYSDPDTSYRSAMLDHTSPKTHS
jgi:spore germination cell wall hydrolase CwlJ-like protein